MHDLKQLTQKLNQIYSPLCCKCKQWQIWFENRGFRTKLGFGNKHFCEIDEIWVEQLFPIPYVDVLTKPPFELRVNISGDIDLEFTFTKAQILKMNFGSLPDGWSVYGAVIDCTVAFDNKNFFELKEQIRKSVEAKFHIGFEFGSVDIEKKVNAVLQALYPPAKMGRKNDTQK
jgi:hypothetical protein